MKHSISQIKTSVDNLSNIMDHMENRVKSGRQSRGIRSLSKSLQNMRSLQNIYEWAIGET